MVLEKPYLEKPYFLFFPHKRKLVEEGKCSECGKEIKEEDFKDELSKKEYSVSGWCQKCQDWIIDDSNVCAFMLGYMKGRNRDYFPDMRMLINLMRYRSSGEVLKKCNKIIEIMERIY